LLHQIDERIAREYEGGGLRLAIVNKLMEGHHGRLTIVSTPGEGAEVSLYFPQTTERPNHMPRLVAA
jgi:signal transduction histidine kinase